MPSGIFARCAKYCSQSGVRPAVTIEGNPTQASSLVVTELISNEGTGKLGARTSGHGWLSVTNLNGQDAIDASLALLASVGCRPSATPPPPRPTLDDHSTAARISAASTRRVALPG